MNKKIGIVAATAGVLVGGVAIYMSTGTDSSGSVPVGTSSRSSIEPARPCDFELVPLQEVSLSDPDSTFEPRPILPVETNSIETTYVVPRISEVETAPSLDLAGSNPIQEVATQSENVQDQPQPVSPVEAGRETTYAPGSELHQVDESHSEREFPVYCLNEVGYSVLDPFQTFVFGEIEIGSSLGFYFPVMPRVDSEESSGFPVNQLNLVSGALCLDYSLPFLEFVPIATNAPIDRWTFMGAIGVHGSRAWALAKEGKRQEEAGNKEEADRLYMRLLKVSEKID